MKYDPEATYTVAPRKSIKVRVNDQPQFLTEGQRIKGAALTEAEVLGFLQSGYLMPEERFNPRETIRPRNLNEKPGAAAKGPEMPERKPVIKADDDVRALHEGRWNHDPANLADKDREQLLVLILETEPEYPDVNGLSHEQAMELLTSQFDPAFRRDPDQVSPEGSIAASAVSGRVSQMGGDSQ